MKRIVIAGSGNIAFALAAALADKGIPPAFILARNIEKGEDLARRTGSIYTQNPEVALDADIVIIAVSDRAVTSVADSLPDTQALIVHTSASLELDVIPSRFKNRAVIYPLQTFTYGRKVDFSRIPFFIEADNPQAMTVVEELVGNLSERVYKTDSVVRRRLHLAAVFACNFTNYMYTVGEQLAEEAGFDFEILKPLIEETGQKALEVTSPLQTQTGPAVRNDFQTKSLHCELLEQRPDLKTIYINLSNKIWETSKKI